MKFGNLATEFLNAASSQPDKAAIFWGDEEYAYSLLAGQARWVAQQLQKNAGITPGDRVGLWLKNSPEFAASLFGIFLADGVAVPINNFLKPDEVSYIANDAGIKVILTDDSLAEAAKGLCKSVSGLQILKVEDIPKTPTQLETPDDSPNRSDADLAVIIYTSGTTGKPKGAMLTHANLLHNVASCREILEVANQDRLGVFLPMFHSFMLTVGVLLPLTSSGSIVLVKTLHPPKNIMSEILGRGATILPAIPQFFRMLAASSLPPDIPLRLCVSGAAPLPVEIIKQFDEKFSIPLLEGYGLSEASPVCSMNPIKGERKIGSIGLPIPNVEMSVQDDEGNVLAPGETGEVCIRGGNVMEGYWNQPEASEQALRNGWLLTGDIGHRDEDNYFYITDRKKDMLLVNGINVYPREIEEAIYQIKGVKEAAVVGKPDPRRGDQPIAFVAVDEGTTVEDKDIINSLKAKLAEYKVPRKVNFMPALPRNATGKILKTELRKLV